MTADSPLRPRRNLSSYCGRGPYPIVRIVTLVALRSRLIAAVRIGPYVGSSELSLTDELLPDVPDNSLFIADRNFLNGRTIRPLRREGVKSAGWISGMKLRRVFRQRQAALAGNSP